METDELMEQQLEIETTNEEAAPAMENENCEEK